MVYHMTNITKDQLMKYAGLLTEGLFCREYVSHILHGDMGSQRPVWLLLEPSRLMRFVHLIYERWPVFPVLQCLVTTSLLHLSYPLLVTLLYSLTVTHTSAASIMSRYDMKLKYTNLCVCAFISDQNNLSLLYHLALVYDLYISY